MNLAVPNLGISTLQGIHFRSPLEASCPLPEAGISAAPEKGLQSLASPGASFCCELSLACVTVPLGQGKLNLLFQRIEQISQFTVSPPGSGCLLG